MKKLSEVLTTRKIDGLNEILQKPELKLLQKPFCEWSDDEKKWAPVWGTYEEYIDLAEKLGTLPTVEQQRKAFDLRFENAKGWLGSLRDYTCPDCQKVTIHKDGCGCKDDESPE